MSDDMDKTLVTCGTCYALVYLDNQAQHDQWHQQVIRESVSAAEKAALQKSRSRASGGL